MPPTVSFPSPSLAHSPLRPRHTQDGPVVCAPHKGSYRWQAELWTLEYSLALVL